MYAVVLLFDFGVNISPFFLNHFQNEVRFKTGQKRMPHSIFASEWISILIEVTLETFVDSFVNRKIYCVTSCETKDILCYFVWVMNFNFVWKNHIKTQLNHQTLFLSWPVGQFVTRFITINSRSGYPRSKADMNEWMLWCVMSLVGKFVTPRQVPGHFTRKYQNKPKFRTCRTSLEGKMYHLMRQPIGRRCAPRS